MPNFTREKLDKTLLIACIGAVFIVIPGLLLYWSHQANSEAPTTLSGTASLDDVSELPYNAGPPPLAPGTLATDFVSTTLDGQSYIFDSHSPHIKIVDFWATWCGPCRMSIPALEDLNSSLRKSGIQTVGVSVDTDTASQVQPFAKMMGMNYTVLVDPRKNPLTQAVYNANDLPSLYIIDDKGIVRWSFSGYWQGEEQYVRHIIAKIQSSQSGD
jgi:thiol-disulfide isomerase/thioredoxin